VHYDPICARRCLRNQEKTGKKREGHKFHQRVSLGIGKGTSSLVPISPCPCGADTPVRCF